MASRPLLVSEAALILFAVEGPCVGIVDMRTSGFPRTTRTGDTLRIEVRIPSIPLVDRQYRIGMYINSGAFVGVVPDLATLIVCPAVERSYYAKYPPEQRGWVELKQFPNLGLKRVVAKLYELDRGLRCGA